MRQSEREQRTKILSHTVCDVDDPFGNGYCPRILVTLPFAVMDYFYVPDVPSYTRNGLPS